jgi:benzylsuccinate CoA-transferase BbsF subunit
MSPAAKHLPCTWAMVIFRKFRHRLHEPIGNRDIQGAAPSTVFATKGDDRWIAISVQNDVQWHSFCDVLGLGALLEDARFASAAERLAHQDELETAIRPAIEPLEANVLAARLQQAGVPAGPVMDARDAFNDPHIAERGALIEAELAESGPHKWVAPSWKFNPAPVTMRWPSAGLGQHNEYVYTQVLGYSQNEYQQLVEGGAVGTEFDASIP